MTTARPVALVTGASSGIGRAAALALADTGFEVVGTSRNTSRVAPARSFDRQIRKLNQLAG